MYRYLYGPGPHVVLFGGVHGNETAGVVVLQELIHRAEKGEKLLQTGTLTVVPIANQQAYENNVRYLQYNMNRLFLPSLAEFPSCYEVDRAEELKEILYTADYFLDLHSTSSPTQPFVFAEKNALAIAQRLGVDKIIYGWSSQSELPGDTENFVNYHGGVGITFEGGQHTDPATLASTRGVVEKFLSIVNENSTETAPPAEVISLVETHICKSGSFEYALPCKNFASLSRGQLIGKDGLTEIFSPYDGYLIMPTHPDNVITGEEVFFIGTVG